MQVESMRSAECDELIELGTSSSGPMLMISPTALVSAHRQQWGPHNPHERKASVLLAVAVDDRLLPSSLAVDHDAGDVSVGIVILLFWTDGCAARRSHARSRALATFLTRSSPAYFAIP